MPPRILIVEPTEARRQELKRVLLDGNPQLELDEAEDGRAALRCLSAQRVHGIVTAWRMPGMDGEGLLAALRRNLVLARKPVLVYDAPKSERVACETDPFAQFIDSYPAAAKLREALDAFVQLKLGSGLDLPQAQPPSRKIVFLCVNASGRGPMAEGLAREALGGEFMVASAGFRGTGVNPLAAKVMQEIGIDISQQPSRALKDLDVAGVEMVINLCFNEMAPVLAGRAKRYDWPLPDPSRGAGGEEEAMARYRQAREVLSKRMQTLAKELRQPVLSGYGL